MTNEEYQAFCKQAWSPAVQNNQLYFAVGLAGEVGEVCEEVKKAYRDARQFDKEKLTNELGDVLWYLANIASNAGISLDTIIERNVEKLTKRHGSSYKPQASDHETGYRRKGPHVELYSRATNKHIRWVPKQEVPKEILASLFPAEDTPSICTLCADYGRENLCECKPDSDTNCSGYIPKNSDDECPF